MIDVLLALLLAVYVWRRPQSPERLLWLAGVILASRCFFEAVMTPYYLTPPLILLLVLAARARGWRFPVTLAVAIAVSRFAYQPLGEWAWWLPVAGALSVVLDLTFPGRVDLGRPDGPGTGPDHGGRSRHVRPDHGHVGDPVVGDPEGRCWSSTDDDHRMGRTRPSRPTPAYSGPDGVLAPRKCLAPGGQQRERIGHHRPGVGGVDHRIDESPLGRLVGGEERLGVLVLEPAPLVGVRPPGRGSGPPPRPPSPRSRPRARRSTGRCRGPSSP